MTNAAWQRILLQFDQNLQTILTMPAAEPAPKAKWCRESAHRTLGHLTSCQKAWLPLMEQLRAGAETGKIAINPDPLFTKLGYATTPWDELVEQFIADRTKWRGALAQVDLSHELKTARRTWSAQTITKRMVEHEKRHLDDILSLTARQ